jgi:hypothetical protein
MDMIWIIITKDGQTADDIFGPRSWWEKRNTYKKRRSHKRY